VRPFDLQPLGDRLRDFLLNCEHILDLTVIALRPQMKSVRSIHKLCGDAQTVVSSTHRPDEHSAAECDHVRSGVSRISQRMRHLFGCVMLLLMAGSALPAETRLPFDSRSLVELDRLDVIPKEVIALLGWHHGGPAGIADRFDRYKAARAAGGNPPGRYLETAGVSSAPVVPQNALNTGGALLSRISGHWIVGPIQKWWLDKAHTEADHHLTPGQRTEVLDSVWEKFPACVKATTSSGQTSGMVRLRIGRH
jgi:hypothetical protein